MPDSEERGPEDQTDEPALPTPLSVLEPLTQEHLLDLKRIDVGVLVDDPKLAWHLAGQWPSLLHEGIVL